MQAAGKVDQANILVTQPRRVAAISLAQRVASERQSPKPGKAGSVVGYNVRLDRAVDDRSAKIVYCTVGILLRMLVCPQEDEDAGDYGDESSASVSPALMLTFPPVPSRLAPTSSSMSPPLPAAAEVPV